MDKDVESIVEAVAQIAPLLHTAGPMSPKALHALFRHAKRRKIEWSLETGAGASTLVLSHLSKNHIVFAEDSGSGSVTGIRDSYLLNKESVKFVDGPTQKTLPAFEFEHGFQLALIDGPHAYPFPELEYLYIYPHLAAGALLVVDDIHVKTINCLFSFLRVDEMFHLDEVVGTTAFFTRTSAEAFSTCGDGWETQGRNRRVLLRYVWRDCLRDVLPQWLRALLRPALIGPKGKHHIRIDHPQNREGVGEKGFVSGTVNTTSAPLHLWVLVRRQDQAGWWPQGNGPVKIVNGSWGCPVNYGESKDIGHDFEIAAISVESALNVHFLEWCKGASNGNAAAVSLPFRAAVLGEARACVTKAAARPKDSNLDL